MSNALFNFELVTPEKILMSDSVSSVSVSGVEGDMTVLANHSPIATSLRPGYVDINTNGKTERFFLTGGFIQITPDEVVVLAESASSEEDLNSEMIDNVIEKTKSLMENASDLQKCVLAKKLNDLTNIRNQL
jgi:F-type H+-transporting ATPase subunit epsilon